MDTAITRAAGAPSAAQGRRPVIGSRYQPAWFERRHADGSYQAFNPPMSDTARLMQRAYIDQPEERPALTWFVFALSLAAIAAAIGFYLAEHA